MTAALTRLPAALVVESQRRRLALATTTAIGIIEHADRFVERRRCDRAGHLVERGLVPVLIEHHAAGATWWDIDHQIGMVRETSFSNDGRNFEMLLQFGNSERARWIFDDLCDGIAFGCSIGTGSAMVPVAVDAPQPAKPYFVSQEWELRELTVLGLQGGADSEAKVMIPRDIDELADWMRATRLARAEAMRHELPLCYAAPLRDRLAAIAADVAGASGGDAACAEAALRREIEAFIARFD